ncbi:MAG: hypothetical protein JJU37_15670 [Balneolaceae bacterium]|nr:hypothetical protein [Balneolaceae bacterium]
MKQSEIIFQLLDIKENVPLTPSDMAESLTVTFYPKHKSTPALNAFSESLKAAFSRMGVTILPFEESLTEQRDKVRPGIVIIEQGEGADENLAIRMVSSLYYNPIVTILDSSPPFPKSPSLQEVLDSIVGVLAWNLTHVPIFLEDDKWTICTMNGAVIECTGSDSPDYDILYSLIPKLSAQVVPPSRDDIVYRNGLPGAEERGYGKFVADFMTAATIWRNNGLMLAHTSIDDLAYRNRFYKRIVSKYLDHRTGMSYGFMVKQLPTDTKPAQPFEEVPDHVQTAMNDHPIQKNSDGTTSVAIDLFEKKWIVNLPDVWLLSTRSGCNKTDLDPQKDILRLGLHKGKITIDTPPKSTPKECRSSYDTYAILAHAIGNITIASILLSVDASAALPHILQNDGLSISHWHGYPDKEFPLPGYTIHGDDNPPVSCSTPQSAAYAFQGKINAVQNLKTDLASYRGDVHIEPHHGTNISGGLSLTETAAWVDKMHKNKKRKGVLVSG